MSYMVSDSRRAFRKTMGDKTVRLCWVELKNYRLSPHLIVSIKIIDVIQIVCVCDTSVEIGIEKFMGKVFEV